MPAKWIRLVQGAQVPVPPDERGPECPAILRAGDVAQVADRSWLARMIRRGDLELVAAPAPPAPTVELEPTAAPAPAELASPTPDRSPR
jgi:hypothetical protein